MNEQLFCAIAYNVHDSSVSFAVNDRVVLVLEAERIFRIKKKGFNNKKEVEYLIQYGLSYLKKGVKDITYWSMTTLQNPLLEKEDVFNLQTGLPRDPHWKKVKILGKKRDVLIVNHHLAHAATYLMSDFKDAVIVTCDGGGDYNELNKKGECVGAYLGKENQIKRTNIDIGSMINGKFYGACSYFLYNEVHCEGKMMALAAYGTPKTEMTDKLESVMSELGEAFYQDSVEILKKLFPDIEGGNVSIYNKSVVDFSASVQKFFSEHRVKDVAGVLKHIGKESNNLVMAGGACLNLDVNSEILKNFPNMRHFIASCCDDTGQSLGAICILINEVLKVRPFVNLPYLGTGEKQFTYTSDSIDKAVDILLKDGVVILHNGQAEVGPRALGNRSLITRPDKIAVKQKLSEKIKQRESYRPVAPVVLEEKVHEYFMGPAISPFMLYKYDIVKSAQEKIKGGIHHDGSARVQTINRKTNPFLYDLIKSFGDKTGIYVLLNTSLNLKGDPVANSIEDTLGIYDKIKGPKLMLYNGNIQ
ncbi:MAG: carbamoyltransferase C-terminal domain-containing protein [bacterium]|nr:carbamoyltransferase C-terminal domain-containing protein [bacterium]